MTTRPVEVTLLVARFRDVLGSKPTRDGNRTAYVMKLARRDPRAVIKGDTLYLTGPTSVRFTLLSPRGDRRRYYPLGISFVREGAPSENDDVKLGFANFPQQAIRAEEQSLTIFDSYRDRNPKVRYKFSLFIQSGREGAVGMIDPDIVHSGDP